MPATRLAEINREAGTRLKSSPLCAEAVFAPIEDLRARGRVTTYGFYAALVEPLCELASQLARTSQRVLATAECVAASVDAEDVSRAVTLPCSPPPTSSPPVLPPVSQRVA